MALANSPFTGASLFGFLTFRAAAKFKVDYHKGFVKNWLKQTNSEFEFDEIWQIREKCIENLTE